MPLVDKTGEPVTVARHDGEFAIAIDEKTVGRTVFEDLDGQRVFYHTEVAEALAATRADGLRIVPVCPTVKAYVDGRAEYDELVDRPTREILEALRLH